MVQAHVAPAQLDAGQLHRFADHGRHVGRRAVGFAALHEGTDALDDLARALGLLRGLLERGQQRVVVDRLALDARHHPVAVVADRGQRLVELVRHARGHLAHGDQPARRLRAVGLRGGLFLGIAARRDVGGDHQLRQAAVDPGQVARAHLEPLAELGHEDLVVGRLRGGQRVDRQARVGVDVVQAFVVRVRGRHAGLRHHAQVADGVGAEPQAVELVGEQQLLAADRRHRHRGVERLEHGSEALVRGRQLFADARGLGDVGHRGHPAGLVAARVDQRRDVQPRIEHAAVLALHAHLEAAGQGAAVQFLLEPLVHDLAVGLEPVGEGRCLADQLLLGPAGHRAEGGVDVGDAALQVEHPHAGQHRVLHRAAEVGLGHQPLLGLQPAARVAPGADQHPAGEHAERADQPEQPVADHALRGAVGLGAQHQRVAHGRDRHFVLVGAFAPGQQARAGLAQVGGVARDHLALGVEQRHRVARLHLGRHAVAQQAIDRELAEHHAREQALVEQRDVQLQHGRRIAAGRGLGEHRLAQLARQRVVALDVAGAQHVADQVLLRRMHAGRGIAGLEAAAVVDPGDGLQLGELAHQRFGAAGELDRVYLAVGGIARDAHQLLLAFQQPQPQALLGVLDVAAHRFLLALDLLGAQVPEGGDDRREEQQHGGHRGQHRDGVLQHRGLAAPPAAPPGQRRGVDGTAGHGQRGGKRHCGSLLGGGLPKARVIDGGTGPGTV